MSITRLAVYEKIKANGSLTKSRLRVYRCLFELGPASMAQVAYALNRKLHAISGRFSELREQGMIAEAGMDRNSSGNPVTLWDVTECDTPTPLPKKQGEAARLVAKNSELEQIVRDQEVIIANLLSRILNPAPQQRVMNLPTRTKKKNFHTIPLSEDSCRCP